MRDGTLNKEEVEIFDKYFGLLKNKSIKEIEDFHRPENLQNFGLTIEMINKYKGEQLDWSKLHTNVTLIAARHKNFNLIKYYLENEQFDFDINYHDGNGHSLHKLMVRYGDFEMMKYLENMKELDIKKISDCEQTTWDTNHGGINGADAFLFAAYYGHLDIMKYFIEKYNWDTNVENRFEDNAYLLAADHGHLHVIKFFDSYSEKNRGTNHIERENCDGVNVYLSAAAKSHFHLVKYFDSKYKNNMDYQDHCGVNAYLYAAGNCDIEMVKYFEEKDPKCFHKYKDEDGENAYMLVASSGFSSVSQDKVIKMLEYFDSKYGNNIHLHNKQYQTPFFSAVFSGKIENIEYMKKTFGAKLDVNKPDKDGCTVYMRMASRGFIDILKYLEKNFPVNLNYKNKKGQTVYEYAGGRKSNPATKYLNQKKLHKIFPLNNTIELNKKCSVCTDTFGKDDLCCLCSNYHVIHQECYFEYLVESNDKMLNNTKCIYCRDEMLRKTIKYEDIHV